MEEAKCVQEKVIYSTLEEIIKIKADLNDVIALAETIMQRVKAMPQVLSNTKEQKPEEIDLTSKLLNIKVELNETRQRLSSLVEKMNIIF
jgi:seryl-tRNA synthetase